MKLTKEEKILIRQENYPNTEKENSQVMDFKEYLEKVSKTTIILRKKDSNETKYVKPSESSRYFDEGRKNINLRIYATLGHNTQVDGVFLTCTIDPKKITREEAWKVFGKRVSEFLDHINKIRERKKGFKRRLSYFWVVEEQVTTGNPHIHIFFPNLKWLYEKSELERLWGLGWVDVEYKTVSIAHYIISYMKKLKTWTELGLSYIWKERKRIYGISSKYRVKIKRVISEWVMVAIHTGEKLLVPVCSIEYGKKWLVLGCPDLEYIQNLI